MTKCINWSAHTFVVHLCSMSVCVDQLSPQKCERMRDGMTIQYVSMSQALRTPLASFPDSHLLQYKLGEMWKLHSMEKFSVWNLNWEWPQLATIPNPPSEPRTLSSWQGWDLVLSMHRAHPLVSRRHALAGHETRWDCLSIHVQSVVKYFGWGTQLEEWMLNWAAGVGSDINQSVV